MQVHVKIADRGWILERMGTELASRLDYITVDTDANKDADIQYYITYSARVQRVSPFELAYFTHLERDEGAARRFFEVANAVDFCICQSDPAKAALSARNIPNLATIPPGVNLERFQPVVRIGVIGRTYHTGRKGEHLVAQVMDMPGIQWLFTGTGWPGPPEHVSDEDLPDFYRSLDYVLVPALNEGGPMCVLEALACGVPVIAPPVGWVPKFPHIEYRIGDVDDLRRVLSSVVKAKEDLRATVEAYSWDNFAAAHQKLFQEFQLRLPPRPTQAWSLPTATTRSSPHVEPTLSAVLLTHGIERRAKGGPSLRVPMTAEGLCRLGVNAKAQSFPDADLPNADIVHIFNAWQPETALSALTAARRLNRPTVLSPIYLDLSAMHLWDTAIVAAFRNSAGDTQLRDALAQIKEGVAAIGRVNPLDAPEPSPGYYSRLSELLSESDHVIFLSEAERQRLSRVTGMSLNGTIVHNPVPPMSRADPALFCKEFGVRDYVLCVGRVETRKNQLMLAYALKDSGIPLVLIGHCEDKSYMAQIQRVGAPNLRHIDRLPPGSELLASAFAGARAFVLPSWAEGAPLAALEAASLGIPLVLSGRSGEREYFGDFARYCDPADPEQMRKQVVAAYASQPSDELREVQIAHFEREFNLERYCADTLSVYRQVREQVWRAPAKKGVSSDAECTREGSPAALHKPHIIVDLTSSAHVRDQLTGITRVEQKLAEFLQADPQTEMSFCAWRGSDNSLLRVEAGATAPAQLKKLFKNDMAPKLQPAPGSDYLVAGGAWMQNPPYTRAVVNLCRSFGLRLNFLVYDLIPIEFPFWARPGYAGLFQDGLQILIEHADRLMVISETTREALLAHCQRALGTKPDVTVLTLGDDVNERPKGSAIREPTLTKTESALSLPFLDRFVLCVGAIHGRKNYQMLYNVWLQIVPQMGSRTPHLVIVGGTQVGGDELRRTFEEDKRINQFVHVLEGIDDDKLEELYRRCMFTLYPSLAEGWGLPVAESLRRGKICLASNIASIREFVPDGRDLLDPLDPRVWIARIMMYATSEIARNSREAEIRSSYRSRSWRDTASQTVACLSRPVITTDEPPALYGGEIALLRDMHLLTPLLDPSSALNCRREVWGISSGGPAVTMRFSPVVRGEGDLELLLCCRNVGRTKDRWQWIANDQPITEWSFEDASAQVVTARIPRSFFKHSNVLFIRIATVDYGHSNADRDSGASVPEIGILGLCLIEAVANPGESNAMSTSLSRRAQVLEALNAAPRAATGLDLLKMPLVLRARYSERQIRKWLKRFRRIPRDGIRVIGRLIQRYLGVRIRIKVNRVRPTASPPGVA